MNSNKRAQTNAFYSLLAKIGENNNRILNSMDGMSPESTIDVVDTIKEYLNPEYLAALNLDWDSMITNYWYDANLDEPETVAEVGAAMGDIVDHIAELLICNKVKLSNILPANDVKH